MKAAFLVDAATFALKEVSDPDPPSEGLVLRVHACGICGSDLRRWREGIPAGGEPIVAGHEISGVVDSIGSNCKSFHPGERLAVAPDVHCGVCYYCRRGLYNLCDDLKLLGITPGFPGGFAEKMVLTGEVLANGAVHRIPGQLSFEEAAFAEPLSSVLACHKALKTSIDDTVVVMGAGPIGCIHLVVSKAHGAKVILSEPMLARRELAEQFEPDLMVDPVGEDLHAKVRELTCGVGADIIICANPVAATQTQAVEIVRKGGKVVLFGGLPKASPIVSLNSNLIHYGEIEVVGSFSYHPSAHEDALNLINRKLIPTEKLITHVFPLDKISDAFEMAASGQALKVLIKV
jgi:L-iditol 2-dehydrogenase